MNQPEIERLVRLEILMEGVLQEQVNASRDRQRHIEKLDELLALRHKGVGAFWLASALLGASFIGLVKLIWSYF